MNISKDIIAATSLLEQVDVVLQNTRDKFQTIYDKLDRNRSDLESKIDNLEFKDSLTEKEEDRLDIYNDDYYKLDTIVEDIYDVLDSIDDLQNNILTLKDDLKN